jgi:prevent-host-death family protein
MPRHAISGHPRASLSPTKRVQPITWKLEDAKVRFSEVVRRGRTEGPQRITVRGKDAVVVIAVETLEKLLPPAKPRQNLVAFLQGLGIGDRDLTGEHDTGRHIIL